MKPNDPVVRLFDAAGIGGSQKSLVRKCRSFNIDTVAQLQGALSPHLPKLNDIQVSEKGLARSYRSTRDRFVANPKNQQIKRLIATFKINKSNGLKILDALDTVKFPAFAPQGMQTALSLGAVKSKIKPGLRAWQSLSVPKTFPNQFILPNYDRCGTVFNQGERGTCVANATCSMLDYATGKRMARQFVYHQCKMIDGIPNVEGTYISTAAQILSDEQLKDYGAVHEPLWKYSPNKGSTTHHGPPPENCFHTERAFSNTPVFVRQTNMIQDIKSILSGPGGYSPSAVVVGVGIYESFHNNHSAETGWITMPLEGERQIGGHAMLVVGWYERETPYGPQRIFLVRNSWGTGWAWNNPEKLPGHALMPFAYFEKYCHGAFSVLNVTGARFEVPLHCRLYNNMAGSYGKTAEQGSGKKVKPIIGLKSFLKVMFLGNAWDR